MLDRTKAPKLNNIQDVHLPKPEVFHLDNGIPVYMCNMGTQDVTRLELIFKAGRWQEGKGLVARTTASLLKEGSRKFSSAEIAEQVDFYGATLRSPANLDVSAVLLYSLNKHFEEMLSLLQDLITEPLFPEKELNLYKSLRKQRLELDLEKNDVVAYRKLTECIYGKHHPYGYNSTPEMYDALDRSDLEKHFKEHYLTGNCSIFVSGKLAANTIELLNKYLGAAISKGESKRLDFKLEKNPLLKHQEEKGQLQKAVRIGRRLFNRQHEDYSEMLILNTVLGGYFGSRLMSNIREEKGYTYNIFSSIDGMLHDGYFYIGTETGKDVTDLAIKETYKEFRRLREESIEEDELLVVRNYMLGNILSSLDGPFNVSDLQKTFILEGADEDYFERHIRNIKNISAQKIQTLAQKYLQEEDFYELVIG